MEKIKQSIQRFLFSPSELEALALLRIFLGIMLMMEALQTFASLDELYGPLGFLQTNLMNAISGKTAPSSAVLLEQWGISYYNFLHIIYFIKWIALVGFTLGFKTRINTVLLWFCQIFFVYSGEFSSYGVDRYYHLLLFLMIWVSCGNAFSLDRWLRNKNAAHERTSSILGLRFIQFAMLITYLDAGVSKMRGSDWWTGEAIWRVLHLPDYHQVDFLWMASIPLVPKLLGWMTILFETFYFCGLWIPYVGVLWILAIMGMHLGIALFMGLRDFGMAMALINAAIFLYPKWQNSSAAIQCKTFCWTFSTFCKRIGTIFPFRGTI